MHLDTSSKAVTRMPDLNFGSQAWVSEAQAVEAARRQLDDLRRGVRTSCSPSLDFALAIALQCDQSSATTMANHISGSK